MKFRKLLFLAIISGLITTFLFYTFMNRQSSDELGEEIAMTEVIVASEDIPEDQKITDEVLESKQIPEEQVHAQAAREASEVVGRFANADIKAGEPVMLHRVQESEVEAEFVAEKVTPGNRAVSLNVDYVKSVSNLIEPEDLVDVVLSAEAGGETIKSEVILEKVRVLSVGQRLTKQKSEAPAEPDAPAEPAEPETPAEEYMAVTLELTPDEAVELVHGSERGRLQLVLLGEEAASEYEEGEQASSDYEEGELVSFAYGESGQTSSGSEGSGGASSGTSGYEENGQTSAGTEGNEETSSGYEENGQTSSGAEESGETSSGAEEGEQVSPEYEGENEEAFPEADQGNMSTSSYTTLPEQSFLRAGPGLYYSPVDIVPQGSRLSGLNEQETDSEDRVWLYVETTEQKEGWISSRIIKQESK